LKVTITGVLSSNKDGISAISHNSLECYRNRRSLQPYLLQSMNYISCTGNFWISHSYSGISLQLYLDAQRPTILLIVKLGRNISSKYYTGGRCCNSFVISSWILRFPKEVSNVMISNLLYDSYCLVFPNYSGYNYTTQIPITAHVTMWCV